MGRDDVIETTGQRSALLVEYGVIDERVPADLDDIVFLAARSCDAEMATISFLNDKEELFASTHGTDRLENNSCLPFCEHVVQTCSPLLVEDAGTDPRFANSPLVTDHPGIRFYFGLPLISPEGIAIGALAVMDSRSRSISRQQRNAMNVLAAQVMVQLELRRSPALVDDIRGAIAPRAEPDVAQRSQALKRINEQLQFAQSVANIGSWELRVSDFKRSWSPEIYKILGISPESAGQDVSMLEFIHPDDRERVLAAREQALKGGDIPEIEHRIIRLDGEIRYVVQRGKLITDANGRPQVLYGTMQDVTRHHRIEEETHVRARQQAVVAKLGQLALNENDLVRLHETAVKLVTETLDVEYSKVLQLLTEQQAFKLVAGVGWQEGVIGSAIVGTGTESQADYTLSSNEPVVSKDLRTEKRFSGPVLFREHGVVSGISAVIAGRQEPWGVLSAHTKRHREFTEDDVNFFQSVANIIAAAIHRTRSEEELEARARQQAAVAKLGQKALQQMDLQALKTEAALAITETLDIEFCKILKRLPNNAGMRMIAGVGWKPGLVGELILESDSDSHAGYTLRNSGPVVIEDLRTETRFRQSQLLLDHGAVSGISVIIAGDHGPWGVLGGYAAHRRQFTQDDVNFCQSIANVIAEATHREAADEVLRQGEALRRIAGRMAHLGAWRVVPSDPHVLWSDDVCGIYDVPAGAMPTWEEGLQFLAPDHRDRISRLFYACLQDGGAFDEEAEIVSAKGRNIWVRIIGQAVRDADGNVIEIQGALQDITEAKSAEAEKRDLAARLATTLESITDAFFTLDREWRFTFVNRQAEQLLRRTREELLGSVVWEEFGDAVDSTFYKEYHRAIDEQRTVEFEAYYNPFDIWLGITAYPFEEGLAVYFRNITDRKRNEAALIESEERFRVVAKATADTIWDWHLLTDSVWWNEGMCTVFGYQPEEVEPDSRSFLLRIHPDDKQRIVDLVQKTITGGKDEWSAEYRFKCKDGSFADVAVRGYVVRDARGEAVRMVGGMNDISRAKERENRLARQATLLDKAHDAIIVHDMQHRVQYWNRSAERLYGWTADEARGQPIDKLLHEDQDVFDNAIQTLIRTGEWSGEISKQRKDGSHVVTEVSWSLLTDESGKPEAIMSIDADITQRLALEEQLRQSQRLESVGQLTGGVAHDFNNLLTVILGNAELMVDRLPEDQRLHKLAEMTRTAALRGAELTHRLLAFARRQALEPRVVRVNDLVDSMNNMLRRTLLENIDIEVIEHEGAWDAYVDPGQLESVLLNMSINAKDAMPNGGRLTIETANVELDEEYAAQNSDMMPGQYVMIAVSDTGTGIAEENLSRVFDPFFTTKEKGKGTGLGLSMAYGFAKQSHGHIKIYSEPGQGTTVKLYLPKASRAGDVEEAPKEDDQDLAGSERILVVEDNDLVRAHAETQLTEYGYDVLTAHNGPEAIELIKDNEDIDLLFTDVIMSGGMNGRDLAEKANRIRPRLKVLYTSGYTENAIVHHGRLDRGVHLLQKPYQRRDLARKVRQVLKDSSSDQPEERS